MTHEKRYARISQVATVLPARRKDPECVKNSPFRVVDVYSPGIESLEDRTMLSTSWCSSIASSHPGPVSWAIRRQLPWSTRCRCRPSLRSCNTSRRRHRWSSLTAPCRTTMSSSIVSAVPAWSPRPAFLPCRNLPNGVCRRRHRGAGPMLQVSLHGDTEVVVLDRGYDGIQQITAILQPYHGLVSEQVLSHGGPGELQLGSTRSRPAWTIKPRSPAPSRLETRVGPTLPWPFHRQRAW